MRTGADPRAEGGLTAEGVTVGFGGLVALSDVSLALGAGEIVGLIGANGAGKSTLINVLSGFQAPSSGTVRLAGRSLANLPPHRVARAGVVRTFQSVRLFDGLSVIENVAAVSAVRPGGRPAAGLLDLLGLAPLAGRRAGTLAYADQRRLAIARALALGPRFLLLDEPAAGMSPEETADLNRTLAAVRGETGLGILLVEHNMDLVMAASDRIVVLDVGRVIATGTPAEVRADPAVHAAYLGGIDEAADAPA
jgi:ABC-type branched-subunit amino acid transport system ATPase component